MCFYHTWHVLDFAFNSSQFTINFQEICEKLIAQGLNCKNDMIIAFMWQCTVTVSSPML